MVVLWGCAVSYERGSSVGEVNVAPTIDLDDWKKLLANRSPLRGDGGEREDLQGYFARKETSPPRTLQ